MQETRTRVNPDSQQQAVLGAVPHAEGARGRQQRQRHGRHLPRVDDAVADRQT